MPHPFIDFDKANGRTMPTIDHLVPVSAGGRRSRKNVRLAHRWCNSRRGDAELTPELLAAIRGQAAVIMGPKEENEPCTAI